MRRNERITEKKMNIEEETVRVEYDKERTEEKIVLEEMVEEEQEYQNEGDW